ncbi:hypothetical protein COX99_01375 [Candidatus Pacearchaeota archaeon CG_4_10_14_0_2_um_filter_31_10]|nr:MAG: hypothetical protein COU55_01940 [Candidatus Pacearchaeota archaeon CG10_big_fil_rev_8_21_14_0_10_31_59]PIZ80946.1 MAG: hypothetical protein COX99_01375 [Candidatus Pacearchaeota archaeon CG_4_10_14_0_2_um_filter_31_10]
MFGQMERPIESFPSRQIIQTTQVVQQDSLENNLFMVPDTNGSWQEITGLTRNGNFEKPNGPGSDYWESKEGSWNGPNCTITDIHSWDVSFIGDYSAMIKTDYFLLSWNKYLFWGGFEQDSAYTDGPFKGYKLKFDYYLEFPNHDYDSTEYIAVDIGLVDEKGEKITLEYVIRNPDVEVPEDIPEWGLYYFSIIMPQQEKAWYHFEKDLREDLQVKGFNPDEYLIYSVFFYGAGENVDMYTHYGQIAYFDGLYACGYPKKDLAVKEINGFENDNNGTYENVTATIKNNSLGGISFENVPVTLIVYDKYGREVYNETKIIDKTVAGDIYGDGIVEVKFSPFTLTEEENYKAEINVGNEWGFDDSDENNFLCTTFNPGITENNVAINHYLQIYDFGNVRYSLLENKIGILSVYNSAGRLEERFDVSGTGTWSLPPSFASGVYFANLKSNDYSETVKLVDVK